MTSTVAIACTIATTDAEAQLGLEAWIDNHKFFDCDHVRNTQQLSIEVDDTEGIEHELRFVLKHKLAQHTQIDDQANIISDARLVVSNICFDEIELGHLMSENAVYTHDFNGTGQLGQHKFYDEMGCNGTVSLKFSTPIYMWLLEHM